MNIGGTTLPLAQTEYTTVKSSPCSVEVIATTLLVPFAVTTRFGTCTVVTPVSSTLKICVPSKLYLSKTPAKLSK